MRLLLLLREINWPALFAVLVLKAAPIVTLLTAPEFTGVVLALSAIALSVLSLKD